MFRLSAVAVFALALPLLAAPVPKGLKAKTPDLNGTWEVTEQHTYGNKVNSTIVTRWVIDGDKLTVERNNPKGVAIKSTLTYSLTRPEGGAANALDYTLTYSNNANPPRTYPGVVEVDGDAMKFFYAVNNPNGGAAERPTEAKADKSGILYVFKRVDAK